jgi:hypothetical protein
MHRRDGFALWLLAVLAAWEAAPRSAAGDEFFLRGGGKVQGEWLNPNEANAKVYRVRIPGGVVALEKSQIYEVTPQRPEAMEYQSLAPTFRDTIADQWKIAEWCRERGLRAKREIHLRRILELDPDHVKARLALGYMQIRGRWVTQRERLEGQGFEFYQGRWRSAQEIELVDQRQQREQAEDEWMKKLARLREGLRGEAVNKAYLQIAAIRDPHAIPALQQQLAREPYRPVRLLYVETLAAIPSPKVATILVSLSVNDNDEEVRFAALERLLRLQPPGVTAAYTAYLRGNGNLQVNRAAVALGQLGDREAIGPLIEALVTVHQQKVRVGGPSDAVSTTFSKDSAGGSGSMFSRGGRTEVVNVPMQNQDVLAALTRLAGGPSFGFDQQAWRNWHNLERSRLETISVRSEK